MEFINPQIDILVIGIIVAVLSQLARGYLGVDNSKMKVHNEKLKQQSKRLKELSKKNDDKSKKEIEELEREMMEATTQMMKSFPKMMLVSMIFYLPAFYFIQANYITAIIPLPIQIPWFGENWAIQLFNETNWLGWYLLCSLIIGLILNYFIEFIGVWKKHQENKKNKEETKN